MNITTARKILDTADLITSAEEIQKAITKLAHDISVDYADKYPLVLTVMGGALIYSGQLLPQINVVMECDYLHVSRYGDVTTGGKLVWIAAPRVSLVGRDVIVLDDILDEGVTLSNVRKHLLGQGAKTCATAVLCEKEIGKDKPISADYVGIRLPNRFVFGFGMDVKGMWRNLPAIYAVKE